MQADARAPRTRPDPSVADRSMLIFQYAIAMLAIIAAVLVGAIR